jgi:ABC-2 type transport system permease protein
VLLCLLIPAMINNYLTARYPVKEAYSTFVKQRDGYHTKWDANTDSTLQAFFRHYPQFRDYVWNSPKTNYIWYYAMQQAGDDESAEDSKAMRLQLLHRQQAASRMAVFFPSMQTQLLLTGIAGTDLSRHLEYLDSTGGFHEQKRLYFYPKIFGDSAVVKENWSRQTPGYFVAAPPVRWAAVGIPFLLFIALPVLAGTWVFGRRGSQP